MACLELPHLKDLHDCAREAGSTCWWKSTTRSSWTRRSLWVVISSASITEISIPSRPVVTTYRLLARIPEGVQVVTESGFSSADQVSEMRRRGVHSFLMARPLCGRRTLALRWRRCSPVTDLGTPQRSASAVPNPVGGAGHHLTRQVITSLIGVNSSPPCSKASAQRSSSVSICCKTS